MLRVVNNHLQKRVRFNRAIRKFLMGSKKGANLKSKVGGASSAVRQGRKI